MKKNLYKYLAGNEYPGRGICLGLSPDGSKAMVAYWIMGRSANSRNRVFEALPERGGIRTVDDFREILRAGADKISINSSAVKNPDLVNAAAEKYGSQCVVVAIDARANAEMPSGFEVYVAGGRTPTGKDAVAWAKEVYERGAGEILLTSMDKDGTKSGFDLKLTKAVVEVVGIPVIASGGCGSLEHFSEVFDIKPCVSGHW